jgi:hypothetical protein
MVWANCLVSKDAATCPQSKPLQVLFIQDRAHVTWGNKQTSREITNSYTIAGAATPLHNVYDFEQSTFMKVIERAA